MNQEICDAVQNGDFPRVKDLIARGADVNATNRYGVTLLGTAIINGNFKVIQYLVEHGADVNQIDSKTYGPLPTNLSLRESLLAKPKAKPSLLSGH